MDENETAYALDSGWQNYYQQLSINCKLLNIIEVLNESNRKSFWTNLTIGLIIGFVVGYYVA